MSIEATPAGRLFFLVIIEDMTSKELETIIDQIESEDLKKKAYFGIFNLNNHQQESHIKANKEGLSYFALELLKAARNFDPTTSNGEDNPEIPLIFEEGCID